MKSLMKDVTNSVAQELDADLLDAIVHEGVRVFELNNELVKSVSGVDTIFYKKLMLFCSIIVAIVSLLMYFLFHI